MWRRHWPVLLLAILPALVHLPALSGAFRFDPLLLVSGTTPGTWQTNGWFGGYPGWIDGNAGVTTEALGALAARDWLHFQVPWWNPYSGIGLPLAAEGQTTALFLPFGLLLALPHGLLALRMLLMALAGIFSFALLRRLTLDVPAAVTGAALFELSGSFAWLAHGPAMPVAFLPLMLLGAEAAQTRFPRALAAGVAWSFLAGFPETAALDTLLAALWCGVRTAQSPAPGRYAARAAGAAGAGLLVAAPAILPFLQALPDEFLGVHAGALSSSFTPGNWALLLFPYLYGNIMQSALRHGTLLITWASAGGYADLALVALALRGLVRRGPEAGLRWALAAWCLLLLTRAGGVPPGSTLFAALPLLRQAMVQVYGMPSLCMALCVLAGFAVQAGFAAGARLVLPRAALALGAAAVLALWAAAPGWRESGAAWPVTLAAILLPVAVLALVAGLWRAGRRGSACGLIITQAAALAMLPLFAGAHGRKLDDGAIEFLQAHLGTGRVVSFGPLVPNYGAYFGVAEINHNYLPVPENWVAYLRATLEPGFDGVNFYDGGPRDAASFARALPVYQALGVRYALAAPGDDLRPRAPGAAPVYAGSVMTIWALAAPLPYAAAPGCRVTVAEWDRLSADCAAPATLTRRALFFPGWRVRVNGVPEEIGHDGIFQTVALPQGHAEIVFRYAPAHEALIWGACAAGLALILAASLPRNVWLRRPAPRPAPPAPGG